MDRNNGHLMHVKWRGEIQIIVKHMLHGSRKSIRRTTRGLLVLLTGAWLLAAVAPCVAAQAAPAPMPPMDCCPDHDTRPAATMGCDALSVLKCQLPNPVPPSAVPDLPVPTAALLHTLPDALMPSLPDDAAQPIGASLPGVDDAPPPPSLNRKHSRLLI